MITFSTDHVTLLDGAMGTMLEREGVLPFDFQYLDADTRKDITTRIHRGYLAAGAQIIYANTFRVNRRMNFYTGLTVEQRITEALQAARAAAADFPGALVALDIGPLDSLVEPLGTLKFADVVDIFAEVAKSGEKAGADLAVIETFMDLQEVRAALLAVKENTSLPVMVTMSFDESGRTPLGCPVAAFVRTVSDMGADAIGFNCSVGPAEMSKMVSEARGLTTLPIIAKSNAGLPDPVTGRYLMTAEAFAEGMRKCVEAGASLIGGCCGTTPEFIAALAPLRSLTPARMTGEIPAGLCSGTKFVPLEGVRAIGERINPTGKKRLQQALLEQDLDHIVGLAVQQQDAGADYLDVNVGHPGVDEAALLPRVVMAVQAAADLPLVIDSTNPAAIEAALRVCCGKAAVNSVNGNMDVMGEILPIVKKYGASVVGLTLGEEGLPATAAQRIAIAERILEQTRARGIPDRDLWIDCLTLTLSAQQDQAAQTLAAIRRMGEMGLHTVLGVSNISFGLPARPTLTAAFLTAAMATGLSAAIVNPNRENLDAIAAWRALSGQDQGCAGYISRFAGVAAAPAPASAGLNLADAIARGLKAEAAKLARAELAASTGLEVVEQSLIPALDRVGAAYEAGRAFLPQLLSAAAAAQAVFEVVREVMADKGEQPVKRGKMVIATVKGDIHDIGKNIVKTVLENYGYEIVDLGKDVPTEAIVAAAAEAPVVGLSALMTTTLPAMEEAVRALKALANPPRVIVGGAVVTEDYARSIGADAYARDARDCAEKVRKMMES